MNIEHPNYTLIAYKSDGMEICMGCTTGSYGSEFEFHPSLRMDECLVKHAELKRREYEDQEPTFEFHVLYRGTPLMEAGTAIHELYNAALDVEIEDQNIEAAKSAEIEALAKEERKREEEAMKANKHLENLHAEAAKLNLNLVPKDSVLNPSNL